MTDIFDQATDQEEKAREVALAEVRSRKPSLVLTGFCHNCDEMVRTGMYFCDVDCRDDWQKRNGGLHGNA
jgi:hypothetical protein